jgi:hypothetical protein
MPVHPVHGVTQSKPQSHSALDVHAAVNVVHGVPTMEGDAAGVQMQPFAARHVCCVTALHAPSGVPVQFVAQKQPGVMLQLRGSSAVAHVSPKSVATPPQVPLSVQPDVVAHWSVVSAVHGSGVPEHVPGSTPVPAPPAGRAPPPEPLRPGQSLQAAMRVSAPTPSTRKAQRDRIRNLECRTRRAASRPARHLSPRSKWK